MLRGSIEDTTPDMTVKVFDQNSVVIFSYLAVVYVIQISSYLQLGVVGSFFV